jgi:hypothetical protein
VRSWRGCGRAADIKRGRLSLARWSHSQCDGTRCTAALCRNVWRADRRRICGLQRDSRYGGSRAARCSEVSVSLRVTLTRTSIVTCLGCYWTEALEHRSEALRVGCAIAEEVLHEHRPDVPSIPPSTCLVKPIHRIRVHARASRKSHRERRGGAVKVRRPRGSGVGVKRRTLTAPSTAPDFQT